MKYISRNSNWKDVKQHLRNKNLAIFYNYNNFAFIHKLTNRLSDTILKFTQKLWGGKFVVSEQIIENPLILRNLREKDKTILDFGGFESVLPLQLTALGYKVTVLDQRPYPFSHPNLTVLCADILLSNMPDITEKFDVVVSISTIEHLGLAHYGDSNSKIEDVDRKAVKVLWNWIKPGGRLMASVPAGKPTIQRGYRVYDEKRIKEVFQNITSIRWFAKKGREGVWYEVQAEDIKDFVYSEPYAQMPVEAVAFVMCDKESK